jgi:hypothetical protein
VTNTATCGGGILGEWVLTGDKETMIQAMTDAVACRAPLAVSTAGGGIARQYRVQFHANGSADWHCFASFSRRDEAEACLKQLHDKGLEARLIEHAICPAAA